MNKKLFLVIAIYLLGCVSAYEYTKYNLTADFHDRWTKGERVFAICLSGGSWITVIAMGIVHVGRQMGNEESATW